MKKPLKKYKLKIKKKIPFILMFLIAILVFVNPLISFINGNDLFNIKYNLDNINDWDDISFDPTPDEMNLYSNKVQKTARTIIPYRDYAVKNPKGSTIEITELLPLMFFSTIVRLSNIDIAYLSGILFVFLSLILMYLLIKRYSNNKATTLMFSLLCVLFPKLWYFPFRLIELFGVSFLSFDFQKIIFNTFSPYFASFRFYHILFDLPIILASIFAIHRIYFKDISFKEVLFWTVILSLNFYSYFYSWQIIFVTVITLSTSNIFIHKKRVKQIITSNILYLIFFLPLLFDLINLKLYLPSQEKLELIRGLTINNVETTAILMGILLFPQIIFFFFSKYSDRKFTFNTHIKMLWSDEYIKILFVLYISTIILSNMNLIISYPSPFSHLIVISVIFASLIHSITLLKLKQSFKLIQKVINPKICVSVLIILIIIIGITGAIVGFNYPFKPIDSNLKQVINKLDLSPSECTILNINPHDTTIIVAHTKCYAVWGNIFNTDISIEENLDRLFFSSRKLNINKKEIKNILNQKGFFLYFITHYKFQSIVNHTSLKVIPWAMTKEWQETLNQYSNSEYFYTHIVIGPFERRIGNPPSQFPGHRLILSNEKYSVYEKQNDLISKQHNFLNFFHHLEIKQNQNH